MELAKKNLSNLNGLILIGGKSTRMGTDKSNLVYHNKKQKEHVFDVLATFIKPSNIYYAIADKKQEFNIESKQFLVDEIANLGPFGAIYTAFKQQPKKAWLVVAIDLPFINKNLIKTLIDNRNTSKIATAFIGKNKAYPEPLITIWEPKVYPVLKQQLKANKLSLNKILQENEIAYITINDTLIQNINTFTEYQKITKK